MNKVRNETVLGELTALRAAPCAAAAVAVGGLSLQPRCNLGVLGQHRGLCLLITATVMKC